MILAFRSAPARSEGPRGGALTAPRAPFEGYGAQLDTDIFTRKGQPTGLAPADEARLGQALAGLGPDFGRVFVRPDVLSHFVTPGLLRPDATGELQALWRTLRLAQANGARLNLTLWYGNWYRNDPARRAEVTAGFARLLHYLRAHGMTCVSQVTIQNEPNTHDISHVVRTWRKAHPGRPVPPSIRRAALAESLALYESLYRGLDTALRQLPDPQAGGRSLRTAYKLIGGDLLRGLRADGSQSQDDWLRYMGRRMGDVLDGYSLHCFWELGRGGLTQVEERLRQVQALVRGLPAPKPVYVTEYGAKAGAGDPGTLGGRPLESTVEAAFEHAWFNALAPQYGMTGLSKWAAYATDGRTFHGWGMIGAPGRGFARTPLYHMSALFSRAVDPGWAPAGLQRRGADELVSAFRAPDGRRSVFALNRAARASRVPVAGLSPGGRYRLTGWNVDGRGGVRELGEAVAGHDGRLTVAVPPGAMVVLSQHRLLA